MKGKVFGLILITTTVIGILSYLGYLGKGDLVQVKVHYVEYDCGDSNLNMKIFSVNDSTFNHLIGKTIAPELTFRQKRINEAILSKVKSPLGKKQTLIEFSLVGYVRKGPIKHCSGALCFKVEKLKYEQENGFIEF